VAGAVKMDR